MELITVIFKKKRREKMKKLVVPLIILCLILIFGPVPAFAHTQDEPFETDLVAGGGRK